MEHPPIETIPCSLECAHEIEFTSIPLKVELIGEMIKDGCLQKSVKVHEPILIQYAVTNLCDDHIFELVAIYDDYNEDGGRSFFCGGEIRAKFDIMPLETVLLQY